MFQQCNPNEMPGVGESLLNTNRAVWLGRQGVQYLPGGARIDGANARDPANTAGQWEASGAALPPNMTAVESTFPNTLEAGLLMGVITSSGLYGSSILGVTAVNTNANASSCTIPAAVAVELVRRIGTSGTFNLIGPPTVGGTVATQLITYTAVNTTSGVVTCTQNGFAASVAGSIVAPNDGSQTPVTFIDELDGIRVTDIYGGALTVQFPRVPIAGGTVNVANIVNYSAMTAVVQTWVKTSLNSNGKFFFSDNFSS